MPRESTINGTVSFRNAYQRCLLGLILTWLEQPACRKQTCKQKTMGTESSCRSGLTPSTAVTSFKATKISQAHVPRCPPPTAFKVLSKLSECIQNALPLARCKFSYKLEQWWDVTATLTSHETISSYTALYAMLAMYWMPCQHIPVIWWHSQNWERKEIVVIKTGNNMNLLVNLWLRMLLDRNAGTSSLKTSVALPTLCKWCMKF